MRFLGRVKGGCVGREDGCMTRDEEPIIEALLEIEKRGERDLDAWELHKAD